MNATADSSPLQPVLPWWKVKTAWLVMGLPASVVLACVATGFFVWHGADTVVRDAPAKVTAAHSSTPALQARNHAATPAEP